MAYPLNVAVASAVRTAVGRALKGTLKDTRPEDLAATVLTEAVRRVPGLKQDQVDDVVLGIAMPEAEQGLNMARSAILMAGWPDTVPAETINRFCSSGLQAIAHGGQAIASGLAQVVVAGGVESMSMVPMSGNKVSLHPGIVANRPEIYIGMGHTAERVAKRFDVSAEAQNQFALASHQKAVAAIAAGHFKEQIVTVQARVLSGGKESFVPFMQDELPRADTTLDGLMKLRPAFSNKGTVTAGNASPLSDGAAACVLMSTASASALGVQPLGLLRHFVVVGVPPDIMGIGPYPAIDKLVRDCGLTVDDIDLFEINEAFAAQAIYCQRMLKIPDEKLNITGGAIALGHPLGCTGAKLTTQLLYNLRRTGGRLGVVSMCIGGGMGAAGLYEIPA